MLYVKKYQETTERRLQIKQLRAADRQQTEKGGMRGRMGGAGDTPAYREASSGMPATVDS